MKRTYLYTPGPCMVPPEALQALSAPIIHHRTPEFEALFQRVNQRLPEVFQTSAPALTLSASGTGAMEAAVVNLLDPGDKALVISAGKFGERWSALTAAMGAEVVELKAGYGDDVPAADVAAALDEHPDAKALFATLSETSTGALQDIEGYGQAVSGRDTLLVVDTVSGLGGQRFYMDKWGVDVTVAGSQKALMLPPGLAFIALSQRAWKTVETSKTPRYYWNLAAMRTMLSSNQTAYTPAVSLIAGLDVVLGMLIEDGMEKVFERHERWAEAMRAGVGALGLELFARRPVAVVTAVKVPAGLDGEELTRIMDRGLGVKVAGGQGEMKGRVFRIAHMGYYSDFDVLTALSALESALKALGFGFEPGAGVAAAQRSLLG